MLGWQSNPWRSESIITLTIWSLIIFISEIIEIESFIFAIWFLSDAIQIKRVLRHVGFNYIIIPFKIVKYPELLFEKTNIVNLIEFSLLAHSSWSTFQFLVKFFCGISGGLRRWHPPKFSATPWQVHLLIFRAPPRSSTFWQFVT